MMRSVSVSPPPATGSITLMVLLMLVFFIIVFSASIRFVALQLKATSDQAQVQQAFAAADAGIAYAGWLVAPDGAAYTPAQLQTVQSHPLRDSQGGVHGTFDLTFTNVQPTSFTVTAVGRDAVKINLCQVIVAQFAGTSGQFAITSWEHQAGTVCPG